MGTESKGTEVRMWQKKTEWSVYIPVKVQWVRGLSNLEKTVHHGDVL